MLHMCKSVNNLNKSLEASNVNTNWDWDFLTVETRGLNLLRILNCQEFLDCQVFLNFQDLVIETVKIETLHQDHVRNWDFKLQRHLRLGVWKCQKFVECQECLKLRLSRLSRLDWLTIKTWILKMLTSRLLIETMSKIEILGYRNCWDLVFETTHNFSTVATWFMKLSRLRSPMTPCQNKRL